MMLGSEPPLHDWEEEEKWVPGKEIWPEYLGGQVVSVKNYVGPPHAHPCPSPSPLGLAL